MGSYNPMMARFVYFISFIQCVNSESPTEIRYENASLFQISKDMIPRRIFQLRIAVFEMDIEEYTRDISMKLHRIRI
jgi:hypothetical protein